MGARGTGRASGATGSATEEALGTSRVGGRFRVVETPGRRRDGMANNNPSRTWVPFRAWVMALAAAAALVALLAALLAAHDTPARAASDRLPDLRMDQARNLQIQNTGGRKLLRFDSIVVNVGAGPFELLGKNRTGSTMTRVEQRVFDDAGGSP